MKGLEKYKEKEEINMCNACEENWRDEYKKGFAEGFAGEFSIRFLF
ncbi:MAG: hypothetical protein K2I03_11105 [Lachnospiraceae bacterium]|nr:hypothetical protein [Lachnospiraceae bacterium]MDE6251547.1 hypothetical protein [Lachnospiraceae bacterium]